MSARASAAKGFSLIELVVAIGLLGVVSTIAVGMFVRMSDLWTDMEAQVEMNDRAEYALARIEEDRRMYEYGDRTVRFYEALSRGFMKARAGATDEAVRALGQARILATELKQDTESTRYSSSHANAGDALEASRAAGGLQRLEALLGSQ